MTKITDRLLSRYGWQSLPYNDNIFFRPNDPILLYDPDKDLWSFAGDEKNFTNWEELLTAYRKLRGKNLVAQSPPPREKKSFFSDRNPEAII